MAKLSLQFHADYREILSVVEQWAQEYELTVVGENFRPTYGAWLVGGPATSICLPDVPNRISLIRGAAELAASTALEFVAKNPGVLTINIGTQTDGMLRESFLSTTTDNAELLAEWKKIRNSLRRSMLKGAWVTNLATGARLREDAHLYTRGAKMLMESGVKIMGPTDMVIFQLD